MGLGDAKLSLGIGWLLGPVLGLYALLGAFIFGAVVSVCILIPLTHLRAFLSRRGITVLSEEGEAFTMKSEVPFGPFLIFSCLTVWFLTVYGVALPLLA
jgi:prepilin signal peptidase PulO-like enzyme (type II secretory pathway)